MPKLPIISGYELIKFLRRKGLVSIRQRGSHVLLKSSDGRRVIVPLHEELDRGTLLAILAEAKISRKDFLNER